MKNLKLALLTLFLLPLMAAAQEAPQITTTSEELSGGIVGKFTEWYISSNQSVTWSVEGDLPEGFTLAWDNWENSYNYVAGTPTTEGELTFSLKVTNSANLSSTKTFTVNVAMPEPPVITTASPLANGTMGESYHEILEAADYAQWSRVSGSLPPGLSFSSYASISGTPTTAGTYNFTVRATNATSYDEKAFAITIGAEPSRPIITSDGTVPLSGTVGQSYSGEIYSDRAANWSITGILPPGISIDNSNSYTNRIYISGTPTEAAAGNIYTFKVKATNSQGSDSATYNVTIAAESSPPAILSYNIPLSGVVDKSYNGYIYSDRLANWSITGNLPPGLSMGDSSGVNYFSIAGAPTEAGEFTFKVKATNSVGSDSITVTVNIELPPAPQITSSDTLNAIVGKDGYWQLISDQPVIWSAEGDLPEGFMLENYYDKNYSTYIYGTPATAGIYSFTIKVTNSAELYSTKTFIVKVAMPALPEITTDSPLANGTMGESYSQTIEAADYAQWSRVSGSLPPGLSFNSYYDDYASISGTPTAAGTYTFTVKATNVSGSTEKTFAIVIGNEKNSPVIETANLSNGEDAQSYGVHVYSDRYAKWSIIEGSLPPGLSETADTVYTNYFVISGYPAIAAVGNTYTFTLKATNSIGSDSRTFSIKINAAQYAPEITSSSVLPDGVAGKNYDDYYGFGSLSSSRGATWSMEGAPLGLEIFGEGSYAYIRGTPTQAGTFTLKIKAANSAGSDSATFTVNIAMPPVPVIATASLEENSVENAYYSEYIEAEHVNSWEILGNLPPGLDTTIYNYGNGSGSLYISGYSTTAAAGKTYTFKIRAVNIAGHDEKTYTIAIAKAEQAPVIRTAELPNGIVGKNYQAYIYADEYAAWSLVEGSLPPGFEIISSGSIKGTPTQAGNFTFKVKAVNSLGSDEKSFSITIVMPQAPVIATASLPNGTVDKYYSEKLDAATDYVEWSRIGNLPAGLYMNSSAEISGYPTTTGTYNFTISATNAAGSDQKDFTIVIGGVQESPKITTTELPNIMEGSYYGSIHYYGDMVAILSDRFATWSIEGDLPPGLTSWSEDRSERLFIYGDPTAAAGETYTFTVTATNEIGSNSKVFSITVKTNADVIACIEEDKVWDYKSNQCTIPTTPIHAPQIAASQIRAQSIPNGIMLQNLPQNAKIEAYNLQGRQIYSSTSHSPLTPSLNIPVSAKGMYIVKISLGSQKQILRVPVR